MWEVDDCSEEVRLSISDCVRFFGERLFGERGGASVWENTFEFVFAVLLIASEFFGLRGAESLLDAVPLRLGCPLLLDEAVLDEFGWL